MALILHRRDSLLLAVLLVAILGGAAGFLWLKPQQQRHEWAPTGADSCRFVMADSLHPHRTRGHDKSRRHKFSSSHKRSSTQWYGYNGNRRPRTEGHALGKSLKFRTDTVLNLNTADTSLLQRVPGIGSYWARRIVDYRNRLGGFVHPNQLDEIDSSLIPCRRWFHVPSPSCSLLAVNRAAFRTLLRHPYLNYQQVCQLMDYRRRHGSLSSLSTLLMLPAFSAADTLRLKPYLSFE